MTEPDGRKRAKLGLALGGGAMVGVAHIGVLEVLDEAGIRPDYIAGTSAGAFVGAAYAAGISPADMRQRARTLKWKLLRRRIFPTMALASPRPMMGYLRRLLGVHRFEDLKIPLAVVTTDLVTSEMVVFGRADWRPTKLPPDMIVTTGDLIEAICASSAIPVIFEPVRLGGRLLVDGFLTNNVPAGLARMMGADRVIAVDLMKIRTRTAEPRHIIEYALSALNVYRYWSVKNRSIWADVVLRPNVVELKKDEIIDSDRLIDAGRVACEQQLENIRAMLSLSAT